MLGYIKWTRGYITDTGAMGNPHPIHEYPLHDVKRWVFGVPAAN
jgi:hypothetical protein